MGKRNGNAFDLAAGTATAHEEIKPGFVDWPPIGCEIENGCENHAEKHLQTRRLNGRSGRQKNGPEDVERVPQLEADNSPTERRRNEENLSEASPKNQSVRSHTGEDHEDDTATR